LDTPAMFQNTPSSPPVNTPEREHLESEGGLGESFV
jgi:hypothetical protein